jgi:uncharacterized protein (TIGR00299 family) protein
VIAYLDLPSGLAGDMLLGCLLDAGWPLADLHATLAQLKLPAGSWEVRAQPVMRGPLQATLAVVQVAQETSHRQLSDLEALLEGSGLPQSIQVPALSVFRRLAEAEAQVHGIPVDQVHFHEVGALDAIVDVVGAVAGLHGLGIQRLYASPVPLGHGWTQSAHGPLPVPAPATLALLAAVQAPTRPAPGPGELVTPTAAALLAELAIFAEPAMRLEKAAMGAGQRQFAWPNVARLWLGQASEDGPLVLLETNIDDMNPELYDAVSRRLFAAGARDVWLTAIQMKKGRPGVLLSVLGPAEGEGMLAYTILRETTTLGVRASPVRRWEAERQLEAVDTPYGAVQVKLKRVDGQTLAAVPEYEDCLRRAEEAGVPVRQVYEAAQATAHQRFLTPKDASSATEWT